MNKKIITQLLSVAFLLSTICVFNIDAQRGRKATGRKKVQVMDSSGAVTWVYENEIPKKHTPKKSTKKRGRKKRGKKQPVTTPGGTVVYE